MLKSSFPITVIFSVAVAVLTTSGCAPSKHRTSAEQIQMVTDRASQEADYSCRPTDSTHSEDYIWLSPEADNTTKTLRISNYSALGKSGYARKELVRLTGVEVSETANSVEFKTGANTSGSYDTEYDVATPTTLLTLDKTNMTGRLRVQGYAGNLAVTCQKSN